MHTRALVENSTAILLLEADDSPRKTLNRRLSFARVSSVRGDRSSRSIQALVIGRWSLGKNGISKGKKKQNNKSRVTVNTRLPTVRVSGRLRKQIAARCKIRDSRVKPAAQGIDGCGGYSSTRFATRLSIFRRDDGVKVRFGETRNRGRVCRIYPRANRAIFLEL